MASMRSLQTLSALRVNHYSPQLTGPEELMWTAMASLYILPEFHASSSEEEGGREGGTPLIMESLCPASGVMEALLG